MVVPPLAAIKLKKCCSMRTYKRETEHDKTSIELLRRAADAKAIKDSRKLKTILRIYYYIWLFQTVEGWWNANCGLFKTGSRLWKGISWIFIKMFVDLFRLLPEDIRKLAYKCAVKFDLPSIPASWPENKKAGADWFTGFLKRNLSLSIRTPDPTSTRRASSPNLPTLWWRIP